jgi:hypothetical protein
MRGGPHALIVCCDRWAGESLGWALPSDAVARPSELLRMTEWPQGKGGGIGVCYSLGLDMGRDEAGCEAVSNAVELQH